MKCLKKLALKSSQILEAARTAEGEALHAQRPLLAGWRDSKRPKRRRLELLTEGKNSISTRCGQTVRGGVNAVFKSVSTRTGNMFDPSVKIFVKLIFYALCPEIFWLTIVLRNLWSINHSLRIFHDFDKIHVYHLGLKSSRILCTLF